MTKKEEGILQLLQYVYSHISVIRPNGIVAKAIELGVNKTVAEYIAKGSPLLKHDSIGDVHVFSWVPKHKNGEKIIPNVYMARAIINTIRAEKSAAEETRGEVKKEIADIAHPVYTRVIEFKVDKFVKYMHDNTRSWSRAMDVNASTVYRDLHMSDMVLTVMIAMNVVFKRGKNVKDTEYMWNPLVDVDENLVVNIVNQRKVYVTDKSAITKYPVTVAEKTKVRGVTNEEFPHVPQVFHAPVKNEGTRETEKRDAGIICKKTKKCWAWTDAEEWAIRQGLAEGMDYKGLADLLGRSEGAVAGKIHWMRKEGKMNVVELPSGKTVIVKPADTSEIKQFAAAPIVKEIPLPKKHGMFKRIWNAIRNK